ncbi:MAG: sporulation protein [Chitinophagales bacterium]|nr:sporulation protein [Chitinophagales bacterium]
MEGTFQKELLGQITDLIQKETKTETLIGKQFTLGEFTCVPVIRMGIGLGAGGGEGSDKNKGSNPGGGAGAGFGVEPMGFLVSKGDNIEFLPTHSSKGISSAFEQMPNLLEKYLTMKEKQN